MSSVMSEKNQSNADQRDAGYFRVVERLWPLIKADQQTKVLQDVLRVSGMSADEAYSTHWETLTDIEQLQKITEVWPKLNVGMQRTFATRMMAEEVRANKRNRRR
ncbi:MAG: hypothetical protein U0930_03765 [Pirellulales bacterium]